MSYYHPSRFRQRNGLNHNYKGPRHPPRARTLEEIFGPEDAAKIRKNIELYDQRVKDQKVRDPNES